MKLRPYQKNSYQQLRESFKKGHKRVLLVLPTGGGKTIIFNEIAKNAKGNVLILVHRQELLKQTADKYGGEIGKLESGKQTPGNRVIVAMVATVVNRLTEIPAPSLIIIDEAHHANATTYQRICNAFECFVVGVTATPCRADGSGLRESFDDMVIGSTVAELVDAGFLARPRVFAPSEIDLSTVKITIGEFDKKQSIELINKPSITGDCISHYKNTGAEGVAVVFCISVQHSNDVAAAFQDAGYSARSIHGGTPKDERKMIVSELGKSVRVLCSCDLISEGFDVPIIDVAILLRPTQSKSLYFQQIGRALRMSEGKTSAVILDHVGNTRRHGHPLCDQNWSLDAEKTKGRMKVDPEDISIRQCERCYSIFPSGTNICESCGEAIPVKSRKIREKEGELIEIEAQKKAAKMEVWSAKSLEELQEIGRKRGYKMGWAKYIWRSRQQRKK